MKLYNNIFRIILSSVLLITGCSDIIDIPEVNTPIVPLEGTVPVYLTAEIKNININGDSPSTKSLTEEEESGIKNYWILQFDGATNKSKLKAAQNLTYDQNAQNVVFLYPNYPSQGAVNRIVILANQPAGLNHSFPDTLTYDGFLGVTCNTEKMLKHIKDSKTIPMSGYVDAAITTRMNLSVTVTRNVAKVTFNLSNAQTEYDLNDISVCNVPSESYLFPHNILSSFPDADKDRINIALSDLSTISSTPSAISFYIPVNKAGSVDGCTSPLERRNQAPSQATFLTITGSKIKDGAPALIYYHQYIGTNDNVNFDVLPNNTYTYNYSITGSNIGTNSNIEKSEINNCYIAVPAGKSDTIIINTAEMVNRYWKKESEKIHPADSLKIKIEVIWGESEPKTSLLKDLYADELDTSKIIKSRVNWSTFKLILPDQFFGNMVVAVKKDGIIRWSYHIWSSSQNPLEETRIMSNYGNDQLPEDQKPVVLRRNLGASDDIDEIGSSNNYVGWLWGVSNSLVVARLACKRVTSSAFGLYYQWGRKDPFKIFGNYTTSSKNTLDESINYPADFFTNSGDWNNDDYKWKDKKGHKTINDPCPKGWKVSGSNIWSNIDKFSTIHYQYKFGILYNRYAPNILFYNGSTDENQINWDTMNFLPTPGYITENGSSVTNRDNYERSSMPTGMGVYWNNDNQGSCLLIDNMNAKKTIGISSQNKIYGGNIRCQKIQ